MLTPCVLRRKAKHLEARNKYLSDYYNYIITILYYYDGILNIIPIQIQPSQGTILNFCSFFIIVVGEQILINNTITMLTNYAHFFDSFLYSYYDYSLDLIVNTNTIKIKLA